MTVKISRALRDALMAIHTEHVKDTQPFIGRDGKTYLRFDEIRVGVESGRYVTTFRWRNTDVYLMDTEGAGITAVGPCLTIGGITGEMEVFIS